MDTLQIDPPHALPYGLLALAAALAVLGTLADPGGRLLALPAAGAVLLVAVRELLAGPVLRADRDGFVARQGWRQVAATWEQVERLRVVKDRRAELLELDLGDTVVVLSRTRLGSYPADVLADLLALRPGGVSP